MSCLGSVWEEEMNKRTVEEIRQKLDMKRRHTGKSYGDVVTWKDIEEVLKDAKK